MAGEYTQGMVSQLLGAGAGTSGGKLAALFTVPAATERPQPTSPGEATPGHKKRKEADSSQENAQDVSPLKKKVKARAGGAEASPSPSTALTMTEKKLLKAAAEEKKKKKKEKRKKKKSALDQKAGQTRAVSVQPPRAGSVQSPAPSAGFKPPPGIMHEALGEAAATPAPKRKTLFAGIAQDDSDDDDLSKKGIREDKRPRRDRLKKADEKRTVFLGNVPLTVDKKRLRRLFKQFGEIESIRFRCAPVANPSTKKRVAVITKEFHDKRHNISAYICFKEKESAENALTLNGHLLDGFHLRVDLAKPVLKDLTKRSLFVGNLPFAIEEESIRQHFEDCGDIDNVRVVRDRKTNLGKGFCFILFKSADSVSLALQLKDSELEKRKLRVLRCVDSVKKDGPGKKPKTNVGDRKLATAGQKPKRQQANWSQKAAKNNRPAGTDQKAAKNRPAGADPKVKRRKAMWQPTNASAMQVSVSQQSALKKKQRKGEKRKKLRSKADEVNRVLGPAPQPPEIRGPKKAKAKAKRKEPKGGKKGGNKGGNKGKRSTR